MSVVCLWNPGWRTDGAWSAPGAERHRGDGRPARGAAARVEPAGDPEAVLVAPLLDLVPRVRAELSRGVVWADARGLPAPALARSLVEKLAETGVAAATAGVATTPVVAEMAARLAARTDGAPVCSGWKPEAGGRVAVVGDERGFLPAIPVSWLEPDAWLAGMLDGVGVATCGELASFEREAVEVRFGADGVRLWKLARGDDPRRLFGPMPRGLPSASLDFIDYVLTDPARLVFVANALLGNVCDALDARGEHARRMLLRLDLANGAEWRRTVRAARPTASRERWLRLIRARLERLTVPDAIVAIHLEVEATEEAVVRQGDLFDPGFATAGAVEAALERLAESYGPVVVAPENDEHPLPERRTHWRPRDPLEAVDRTRARPGSRSRQGPEPRSRSRPPTETGGARADGQGRERGRERGPAGRPDNGAGEYEGSRRPPLTVEPAGEEGEAAVEAIAGVLTLQLLAEPRPIRVETRPRRDHQVPVRYHDGQRWRPIETAAGPDRLSGDRWAEPFAREYFRCVDADGTLVWIYRDGYSGSWHLHGWWD